MVERLNRTLKTMTMRALNNKVTPGWSDLITGKILKNYNSNYHSSIKTSPKQVIGMTLESEGIKEIAQDIKDRAIRHGEIDQGAYEVGDFVRIKIFKPTKLGEKYTFNGGLAKIDFNTAKVDPSNFDGVFLIHSVQKGSNTDKGSRQTTYRIVSNWSHESKTNSLPTEISFIIGSYKFMFWHDPLCEGYFSDTCVKLSAAKSTFLAIRSQRCAMCDELGFCMLWVLLPIGL